MADDIPLATLVLQQTKEFILQKLFDAAHAVGLDAESWQGGDPTRSLYHSMAARFEYYEERVPAIIKGGLLGLATLEPLTDLLKRNYNVKRRAATYATCSLRLTNTTSANFGTFDPDDITAQNNITKATFRNQASFSLGPSAVVDIDIEAETAGTGSNSLVGEITELLPGLPGVTVTNTTAAVAKDEETDPESTLRGQAKLESTSPNGPKGAYEYFATTPSPETGKAMQQGIESALDLIANSRVDDAVILLKALVVPVDAINVTRVHVHPESDLGFAVVFIAGPSGAVTADDRTDAEERIETWANPFVVDAPVINSTNLVQAVTYELWVYDTINLTTQQIKDQVAAYLAAQIITRPIGGDKIPPATSGYLYKDWLEAQILQAVAPHGFKCTVSTPAADVALAVTINTTTPASSTAQVATLGTITATVNTIAKGR